MTASLLMRNKVFKPLEIIGLPDEPIVSGSQEEIFRHYGMTADGIVQAARHLLDRQ